MVMDLKSVGTLPYPERQGDGTPSLPLAPQAALVLRALFPVVLMPAFL